MYSCKTDKNEILALDRNSYPTHVILPKLSCVGYWLVVLELTHMVIKWRQSCQNDVNV